MTGQPFTNTKPTFHKVYVEYHLSWAFSLQAKTVSAIIIVMQFCPEEKQSLRLKM